jgi:hypothetical protein
MSAESAIQPVYANHADQIEAALSALFCDVYDFLGRCPRLEMTHAFGAEITRLWPSPTAEISPETFPDTPKAKRLKKLRRTRPSAAPLGQEKCDRARC